MKQVRVLVVDNSPSMRAVIKSWVQRDPEIAVVGEAGDPYEAREAVKVLSPDVITLDVNMPRMNGLEFLEKLMRARPTPVIMVSSRGRRRGGRRGRGAGGRRLRLRREAGQRRHGHGVHRARLEDQGRRRGAAIEPRERGASQRAERRVPPQRPHRRHRRLHRRRRRASVAAVGVPGQLSADGGDPAHARELHPELRRPPRPALRRERARSLERGAARPRGTSISPPAAARTSKSPGATSWPAISSRASRARGTARPSTGCSPRWQAPDAGRSASS